MTDNSISMFSRYAELNRDDWVLFFILYLLFMLSPRHLLIFSSGIKVIDKLFEEKLAKMLFFL